MENANILIMALNSGYHMMIGACLLLKLKKKGHVLYLAIPTLLYSLFVIFTLYNDINIFKEEPNILFSINLIFVLIMLIVNIIYFSKATKGEIKKIIGVVHACLLVKGTKEEKRKIQDKYFDQL